MEIKYSNYELDEKIFKKGTLYGLYDRNSNFILNRITNIETIKYNSKTKVNKFLFNVNTKNQKAIKKIKSEFGITNELEKKKMCELTSLELTNVLIIKAIMVKSKVLILDHYDAFLSNSNFKRVMLNIKNCISYIDKTVIFVANKIDNIITTTNNYVIASENRIIHNGNNINSIHESTEIMKFVDAANQKGAKLDYYKDSNDLLKAIYRSVKK